MTQGLVIGGGPAGLAAAKSLLDRGAGVVLVERSDSLGGMARNWTCKGIAECRNCGVCFAIDRAEEVLKLPAAEVLLLSEAASVERTPEGYSVKVKTAPRYVTDDCIGCGKCVDVCPAKGKAIFPPTGSGRPRQYWIDRNRCLHFKKAKCNSCADVCPTKAIDFEDRAKSLTRKVDVVVFATGVEAVEASETSRLGCGRLANVISSVDAEKTLNEKGKLARPSDGQPPKRIAVIQCVGSRSVKSGVEYCSKFCCKYATKICQLLLDIDPEINLDFYFMDLRTLYEPQDEFKAWAKAKKTVKLVRSMPAMIYENDDSKNLLVRVVDETDLEISEKEYDLVMLSVGMRPSGASSELAKALGIKTDEMGFAQESADLEASGVFICGAVAKPMDIEETTVRTIATTTRMTKKEEVSR